MTGQTFGHYQVIEKLGEGGMGSVWKARDTRLDRLVALKVLRAGKAVTPEIQKRFTQEARAASALNHPNIVTVYDIWNQDGAEFIVMEYIDGKPLDRLIPRKGMRLPEALSYAIPIADALTAAHAAGIVHRDLKPANIMVTQDGRVKVVDFGLAKSLEAPQSAGPEDATMLDTAEGTIVGTTSYMSPEQAQGKKVDTRADIFSFGAVLYEMLTGTRAFQGDSPLTTLAAILDKEPRPASQLVEDLPREVESLIRRCLRKDPARRWQNMADLKVALLDLKEESDSGQLTAPAAAAHRRRLNPIWIAAALLVLLTASALAIYFARTRESAPVALRAVPLTTYPGSQSAPSFSPDGNQVAFAWNGPQRDNWDIYVKLVGEGEPLRLTSSPADDYAPAWSPDGRWIAFERDLPDGRFSLMLISPLGGGERKLADFGHVQFEEAFAWTPDSTNLVVPARDVPEGRNGLLLLNVNTREVRQLTKLAAEADGDTMPALSPDGHTLAFRRIRDNSTSDIYTLALSDNFSAQGEPVLLLSTVQGGEGLAWSGDGKDIVFSSGPQGRAILQRIAPGRSASPRPAAILGDGMNSPAIARPAGPGKASRLAWSHPFSDTNIYRLDLAATGNQAGKSESFASSSLRDVFPQYSPDGKRIVLYSDRGGTIEIWTCDATGSGCRPLTSMGGPVSGSPRWSPDGQQVAFDSNKDGTYQIYVVAADGGSPRRLTNPPSGSFNANWSLDGRWIYFGSNRSGTTEVWKMPAAGGTAEQVTHKGGYGPTVSPDGKFLYYVKDEGADNTLWRTPLEGGAESRVLDSLNRYTYAVTRKGVYYSVSRRKVAGGLIQFLDFSTGRTSTLATTDKSLDLGLTVSPDGRYLLYSQIDFQSANLMLVENFR